ncbi:TonB-dependent receptor plug domain-containing protein [Lewinella sp. W8]|uniref:TonB-dependent receptor plug domain-containing protein n=1 Tax=Lewinella sp. W8 TaxID=2528208 RepID=UPI001563EADB
MFWLFLWGAMMSLHGQSPDAFSLSAEYTDVPLKDVLQSLETERGLRFSFQDADLEGIRVSCSFRAADWNWVEQRLLGAYGLQGRWLREGYVTVRRLAEGADREWRIPLHIVDPEGKGLSFAQIGLLGSRAGGVADEEGSMSLRLFSSVRDTLLVSNLGFEQQRLSLRDLLLSPDQVIRLTPLAVELGTIEIREYLTDGILASPDGRRLTLTPNASANVPGFVDQEVYRLAGLLPGITNQGETAGNLSIRGGSRDQNLILWDGIPVYSPGHYFGMISNFSPELIDKMQILRGQADAAFGGRVSGLINMETDREVVDHLQGGAGLSLLGVDGHLKVPLVAGSSDLHLAGRSSVDLLLTGPTYSSYRDGVLQSANLHEIFGGEETESFNFRELNGRLHWDIGRETDLTLSGFTQYDQFTYASTGTRQFTDALETDNHGLGLNLRQSVGKGESILLQAAFTRFENQGGNQYSARNTEISESRLSGIEEYSLRAEYERITPENGRFKVGLQGQQFAHTLELTGINTLVSDRERRAVNEGEAQAMAAFGSWAWNRPSSPLSVEVGLRAQYYAPTDELFFEPRLDGSYRVGKSWWLKAGFGETHQFPVELIDFNPESVGNSAALWVLADGEKFPVANGREVSLGFTGQPGSWFFDVELYYKRINGLSSTSLDIDQLDNVFVEITSRNQGLNALLKKRIGPWRSWVIYTLSKSEWEFPGRRRPPVPADNDRRHELQLMNSFSVGPWTASLGWRWHTGARFTRVLRVREEVVDDRVRARLDYGRLNAITLPAFHRLDFSLFYNWQPPDNSFRGQLGISFLNVYDQSNILHRQFFLSRRDPDRLNPSRFSLDIIDTMGLGFTPNIKLSISWR